MRLQLSPFITIGNLYGFQNANKTFRSKLLNYARGLNQKNETGTGSVHNRNFRRIHINVAVIDSKAIKSTH